MHKTSQREVYFFLGRLHPSDFLASSSVGDDPPVDSAVDVQATTIGQNAVQEYWGWRGPKPYRYLLALCVSAQATGLFSP
ncbi:MAG: hypothetical protein ABMA02_03585 [Saprospiraceae bacterium]